MADEPVVAPAPAPVAEGIDPKTLEAVQGAVRASIEQLMKEGQARQAAMEAERVATPEPVKPGTPGPFDEMFRPAMEPVLKAAQGAEQRAALAADAVQFYTDPDNAPAMKYRQRIEKVVADQAKAGNLTSRRDVWQWLRGGELYGDLQKEGEAAYQAKIEAARKAEAAGSSTPVQKFTKPVEDMTTDELGTAMRGVTF